MCDYEVDWSPPSLYQLCLYKTAKHIVGKTIDPNNLNVEQVEGFHVVINSFHRLKLPRTVKRDLARTTNMMRSAMIKWLKIMFAKWKLMIRTEDYIANIQWGTFGDLNTANTIRFYSNIH
uniref:Uncharacterized protein n=1 Tax=Bracon brevicornis TaxID=1563983 RepID=A0A6V7K6F1_9HYME